MPVTKENAPSRGTSSAEGNDQNPTKGTIMNDANTVPDATDIALASIERARRPHWAPEGTWGPEAIYYARTMTHGTVKVDVFLNRTPLDWTFGPTEINVLKDEGIDVDAARLVAADLAEAIAILEGRAVSAVVDARFAGGPILVTGDAHTSYDPDVTLVQIDAPGWVTALFPHEARALAAALTAAANAAERAPRLKRHPDVDDHLRGLDE